MLKIFIARYECNKMKMKISLFDFCLSSMCVCCLFFCAFPLAKLFILLAIWRIYVRDMWNLRWRNPFSLPLGPRPRHSRRTRNSRNEAQECPLIRPQRPLSAKGYSQRVHRIFLHIWHGLPLGSVLNWFKRTYRANKFRLRRWSFSAAEILKIKFIIRI